MNLQLEIFLKNSRVYCIKFENEKNVKKVSLWKKYLLRQYSKWIDFIRAIYKFFCSDKKGVLFAELLSRTRKFVYHNFYAANLKSHFRNYVSWIHEIFA